MNVSLVSVRDFKDEEIQRPRIYGERKSLGEEERCVFPDTRDLVRIQND